MDRRKRLLENLSLGQKLIEIGASHNPIISKRDGWNTCVVDHAARENLLKKYSYTGDRVEVVEDVDVVWTSGALHEHFPINEYKSYDNIVASHVLEHLPNPISFLKSCEMLLKPGGRIILALPDKRRCFDYFGNLSTTGDVLESHLNSQSTHTARTAFNDVAYAVSNNGAIGWSAGHKTNLSFLHSLQRAHNCAKRAKRLPLEYFDHHAWRFVPSSFALIILELSILGYLSMKIDKLSEVYAQEFFVDLVKDQNIRPTEEELMLHRMALLKENLCAVTLQLQEMGP